MHLPAYAVVGRFAGIEAPMDKTTLIVVTTSIFLAWALMLSQAIESVTRIFYARADLDLIVSSPVALPTVFSVRLAAVGLTVTAMALLLATPFIDVLVIGGGARWFAVYGVVVAVGLSSTAVAIAVTVTLFRSLRAAPHPAGGANRGGDHRRRLRHRRCRSPRSSRSARCRGSRC